ncbi:undecaprenyl/decaprenyl-phosphate alpha-N-acetylglucosaminyl 1-phosphate transferase [Patescibacteria group bacterium]|nr:undecaprenyl/decaprenyl-phosphate alpha-N-acetylglucosaminyl 1-phosphate transferase [Patescibacteria group bacterium]MBU4016122.1 undecaprenyl/decaprenyl-phosphate alpha-N-acetylglucosaminyl 1-phosphate transferase [Patescibacteria group bacterium]
MKYFGLVDNPKTHKHPAIIHTKIIPRGGGIPLFLGALITGLLVLPITKITIAVFFAAFLALIIGIIDDKLNAKSKDVSPYLRFLVNILTAIIVVASGVSIRFVTNPFGGIIHLDAIKIPLLILPVTILLSDFISVIWLIWVMNMLNWSKGIDGQMPGIVAISAIVIGILSLRFISSGELAYIDVKLSFIIAGCALGFLIYNFYPAKIFPGYGATALYLLLGVVSILSGAKLATAILVMGIPTVDAIFTIIRRILQKQQPFLGDKKHLHHMLLRLGYSQRQIALFYWVISAVLGIISLTLQSSSKIFAIMMLLVVTIGALFFLHTVVKNESNKTTS